MVGLRQKTVSRAIAVGSLLACAACAIAEQGSGANVLSEEGGGSGTAGSASKGDSTKDGGSAGTYEAPLEPSSDSGSGSGARPCSDDSTCDDGNRCTVDRCLEETCSHAPVHCDDGVACTVDTCDSSSGRCQHAPDHAVCDDQNPCNGVETCAPERGCAPGVPVHCLDDQVCTQDLCAPSTGTCEHPPVAVCASGDGCCPQGCSAAFDNDCACVNLARNATPSSTAYFSDDGVLVDGLGEPDCLPIDSSCPDCFWYVNIVSTGLEPWSTQWLQLEWPDPVTIGSMFLDGIGEDSQTGCSGDPARQTLAAGTVQYLSADSLWVDVVEFSGHSGDIPFDFDPPLETRAVRIQGAVHPPGGFNPGLFEWYAYGPKGCTPP